MNHRPEGDMKLFDFFKSINPESVLDCGLGHGTNGHLIRMYLKSNCYLEGFDIFKPYIERQRQYHIYDLVYEHDIKNIIWKDQKHDLIIINAVFEHLEKRDVFDILDGLLLFTNSQYIMVPYGFKEAEFKDENEGTRHRCDITIEDFKEYGYNVEIVDCRSVGRIPKFIDNLIRLFYEKEGRSALIVATKSTEDDKTETL